MANIKKDEKTGTYYFKISLGTDPVTGKRRQTTRRGFKKKADAVKVYNELKNQYYDGVLIYNNSTKLKDFYVEYKKWMSSQVRVHTMEQHFPGIEKNIIAPLGEYKLEQLTPMMIQQWQQSMVDAGFKKSYINFLYKYFVKILDRAVILNVIPNNPASKIGNLKKEHIEVDFWTEEELFKVLATFDRDSTPTQALGYIMIKFLFYTGLRFGEAHALQWRDIDFDNCTVFITKDLYYKSKENWKFDELKTAFSKRLIALDNDTCESLIEWKMYQNRIFPVKDDSFVFSYDGLPIHKVFLNERITTHAEKASIKKIRPHALRHSHASFLISLNINILAIAKRLGHKDANEVLRTYGHLYPEYQYDIAQNINDHKK